MKRGPVPMQRLDEIQRERRIRAPTPLTNSALSGYNKHVTSPPREDRPMYLTDAANATGIDREALKSAIRYGNLRAERDGRYWKVSLEDIQEALRTGKLRPGRRGRPPQSRS